MAASTPLISAVEHRSSRRPSLDEAPFGVFGYALMRLDMDPSPLMLGFILGPMLEENFRRATLIGHGGFSLFVTRPISATLLTVTVLLIAGQLTYALRSRKPRAAYP